MNLNYRLRLITAAFLLLGFASSAQNSSVSIGTANTNSSAVLWLNSPGQNQGLIIPVGSRTNVATPVKGMLIFDTNQVYAYDGTNWNTVGGSGSASTYSLSYNAATKVITLNPNTSGTATIDISTTALSGGDLGGTLGTPSVTGILGKSITLPSSGVQYLSYDVTQNKWVFQTPSGSLPAAGVNQILTSNASSIPTWSSTIPGSQVTPNFGAQNISTTGTLAGGATTVTGLTISGATTSFNNKTYSWPNNPTLTAGTILQTDASGNLSWQAVPGGTPYSAGTGLSLTANTFSVNASQNISTLSNLISNGLIKTSGGTGALGIATAGTDYLTPFGSQTAKFFYAAPNAAAGVPSFRAIVASDIPALNQSTTGSAGSVTNALSVDNSSLQLSSGTTYNGSAALTMSVKALGITNAMLAGSIASSKLVGTDIGTVGTITAGTWNGTKISEAYGGTNQTSYAAGDILYASTPSTLSKLAIGSPGQVLTINAGGTAPVWQGSKSAFRVFAGSVLSLTASSQPIPFNTLDFDISSNFSVTNNEFVAPVKGVYSFSWKIYFNNTGSSGNYTYMNLQKNGISVFTDAYYNSGTVFPRMSGTTTLLLLAGDKISVAARNGAALGTVESSNAYTEFSGFLIFEN